MYSKAIREKILGREQMRLLAGVLCLTLGFVSTAFAETVRLSPKVRVSPAKPGKPIAGKDIMPYLQHLYILEQKDYDNLPVAKQLDGGTSFISEGDAFVVRDIPEGVSRFDVIKKANDLKRTADGKEYGIVANKVGEAVVEFSEGNKHKMRVTNLLAPMIDGMHIIPEQDFSLPNTIYAHKPDIPHIGRIISLLNKLDMEGNNQAVIINIGSGEGIAQGTLLDVYPRTYKKPGTKKILWQRGGNKSISVSEEVNPSNFEDPIGEVMVYKVYDEVSLAIITYSKKPITLNDMIVANGKDY